MMPGWIYCLATVRIFYGLEERQQYADYTYIDGLMLLPLENGASVFRRIGMFTAGKDADFATCERMTIEIV